jgi:oligopeptide transport system ATP-binding protein
LPRLDEDRPTKLLSIEGLPPDLVNYPRGCPFYARCNYRLDKCADTPPVLEKVGTDHYAACHVDVTTAKWTTEHPYQEFNAI